ncbi:protein shortage in chiasmata 1 ortholog [Mantella aurantiaca]
MKKAIFPAFKFLSLDYAFENVMKQKLAISWMLIPFPNEILQEEDYCHARIFVNDTYRRPWKRSIPTCNIQEEDSVIDMWKTYTSFGDFLERKEETFAIVPSSNPCSQIDLDDMCSVSESCAPEASHTDECWKTIPSSNIEYLLPEEAVFIDCLLQYRQHLPSLSTLHNRLKIIPVQDPLIAWKETLPAKELIFRMDTASEKDLEPDLLLEEFHRLLQNKEECLILPSTIEVDELCTEWRPSVPDLIKYLQLVPEEMPEASSEGLLTQISAEQDFIEHNSIDKKFELTKCENVFNKVYFSSHHEAELEVPFSPPNIPKDILDYQESHADVLFPMFKVPFIPIVSTHYTIDQLMEQICITYDKMVDFTTGNNWWNKFGLNVKQDTILETLNSNSTTDRLTLDRMESVTRITPALLERILEDKKDCVEQTDNFQKTGREFKIHCPSSQINVPCPPLCRQIKVTFHIDSKETDKTLVTHEENHQPDKLSTIPEVQDVKENTSSVTEVLSVSQVNIDDTNSRDVSKAQTWQDIGNNGLGMLEKDDVDPLSSFINLRTIRSSHQVEEKNTDDSNPVRVNDAENRKPEHGESQGLSSDVVSPQEHTEEPKHQMLTVRFTASESQCQAYGVLQAAAVPVLNKLTGLGVSACAEWKFASIRFDSTRFLLCQQEKIVTNGFKIGKKRNKDMILFKNASFLHILVTLRDLILTCTLAAALARTCCSLFSLLCSNSRRNPFTELSALCCVAESAAEVAAQLERGKERELAVTSSFRQLVHDNSAMDPGLCKPIVPEISEVDILGGCYKYLCEAKSMYKSVLESCLNDVWRKLRIIQYVHDKTRETNTKITALLQWMEETNTEQKQFKILVLSRMNSEAIKETLNNSIGKTKGVPFMGRKWAISVRRSTTTRIEEKPADGGLKAIALCPVSGNAFLDPKNVLDSLRKYAYAIVNNQYIGSDFPWAHFSIVIEYDCTDVWLKLCQNLNILHITLRSQLPDPSVKGTSTYYDKELLLHIQIPHVFLSSEGLTNNPEILHQLESRYNMTFIERECSSSLQLFGKASHCAVITVDESTVIILQSLEGLMSDKSAENLILKLVALSLQYSCCWVLLYSKERLNSEYSLSGITLHSVALVYAAITAYLSRSEDLKIKTLISPGIDNIGLLIRRIADHTLMLSTSDPYEWLDKSWLSNLLSEEERVLLSFPSVNPMVAQRMLSRGCSLQRLLSATNNQLKELFPEMPSKVLKHFSDYTALHKLSTSDASQRLYESSLPAVIEDCCSSSLDIDQHNFSNALVSNKTKPDNNEMLKTFEIMVSNSSTKSSNQSEAVQKEADQNDQNPGIRNNQDVKQLSSKYPTFQSCHVAPEQSIRFSRKYYSEATFLGFSRNQNRSSVIENISEQHYHQPTDVHESSPNVFYGDEDNSLGSFLPQHNYFVTEGKLNFSINREHLSDQQNSTNPIYSRNKLDDVICINKEVSAEKLWVSQKCGSGNISSHATTVPINEHQDELQFLQMAITGKKRFLINSIMTEETMPAEISFSQLPQQKRRKLLYERVPGRCDGQTRLKFF